MAPKFDFRVLSDIAVLVGATASVYYVLSLIFDGRAGPARSKQSRQRAEESLRRLRLEQPDVLLDLDEYEQALMATMIGPDEIKEGFADIGGLDNIVDDLRESVLLPLTMPELVSHSPLLQAPKGVLLYGPPGCGKTLLARALAKESGANFLNIKMSTLLDKWFGESNKLVSALFSLANKLQPCIIFIDEIDSFLRERASSDHEVTAMMKAEFMTMWDGLTAGGRILVLGATNRPNDIDAAILRRMPKRFSVPLPTTLQRRRILSLLLKDTSLDEGFDFDLIANQTAGLSGSDLKEVCRDAAMRAYRDYIKVNFKDGHRIENYAKEIRPLRTSDFLGESAITDTLGPD